MIRDEIREKIHAALDELGLVESEIILEHPDSGHGDYATNIALILAKRGSKNPRELAERIAARLQDKRGENIRSITVAGPGFVNFHLTKSFFAKNVQEILSDIENFGKNSLLSGKKIMVEYTDPNPFKVFHIGHLMTNTIGESLARLFEFSGAEVKRANYQGDVGLHIAKAIAAKLRSRAIWITAADVGASYAQGEELFAKESDFVQEVNKKVYEKSDDAVNDAYAEGRAISLAAFEEMYKLLGTKFDFYFFESEVAEEGKNIVLEYLKKGVFEKSEGAVIFRGEPYGFHTRVFLTKEGLPPYEAKDLALAARKFAVYPYDKSFVITALEQNAYYAVVRQAMSFIYPELAHKTVQIGHGMMRVASGKMSSRKGNVVTGESLVHDALALAAEKIRDEQMNVDEKSAISKCVGIGALKFSILKQQIKSDIVYDEERSFSLEGDSGPYLQYAAVRANAVRARAEEAGLVRSFEKKDDIHAVERLLYQFPEIVERAAVEHEPHHIATYLIELAGSFNSFYAAEKIIGGGAAAPYRLALTEATFAVLKNGLHLLGIGVPGKM
ncbi:MAG: arginyl-tRNA synthetase [Parcubacteria group bacterium Gr01-1014_48]|nr:MAG: arginyl-tRNA synthetase [Parcubacteria group bacterium Gr01-1014_48]